MRILLRTACGCERIINEAFGLDPKPESEIVVPCTARVPDYFRGEVPKSALRVYNRRFRLTDQTWVGPGDELFIYEEVL